MNKVWLVTGSASGLGRNIAEAVLESGDRLVATARDATRLVDLVEKYGDRVRAVPLDVTDECAAQAAVPLMRAQRSGCILQISSVGGRLTRPGSTPYHAAKWAVGGFTESLAQELSPFGVKVCALEPGGMRTNWGARANQATPELLPDYEPSVGAIAKALKSYWGKEISDPAKVAQVVLRLASGDRLPAHLLIGSDAVRFAAEAEKARAAEGAQWRDVSLSTDVASATALPAMRF